MKTLKKIILAAMFTAALTAFIACDNDDSSGNENSSSQPTLPYTTMTKMKIRSISLRPKPNTR